METSLPKPVRNADSIPYWDGAREGKLLLRRCQSCGALHFMPRHLCPACWSDRLEWIQSKGTGTVHTFTVIHRAPLPAFASQVPYVVAMIELDEGPRMVANILGEDARSVAIGDRVEVMFEDRGDGDCLPQFRRVAA